MRQASGQAGSASTWTHRHGALAWAWTGLCAGLHLAPALSLCSAPVATMRAYMQSVLLSTGQGTRSPPPQAHTILYPPPPACLCTELHSPDVPGRRMQRPACAHALPLVTHTQPGVQGVGLLAGQPQELLGNHRALCRTGRGRSAACGANNWPSDMLGASPDPGSLPCCCMQAHAPAVMQLLQVSLMNDTETCSCLCGILLAPSMPDSL